ncbi:MAG: hypothetical protein HRU19_00135 [Pseudobacteriovorax sp.]|nr:hypothetical protein [Pseudobacteriovorax sp.]
MTRLMLLVGLSFVFFAGGCTKSGLFKPQKSTETADLKTEKPKEQGKTNPEATAEPEPIELTPTQKATTDHDFIYAAELLEGAEQTAAICKRLEGKPATHPIKRTFCDPNNDPVLPTSLQMMQDRMGLRVPVINNRNQNGAAPNPGFAVQGHSSSLVGQFVSSINPRVIIFNAVEPSANQDFDTRAFVAMGFVRGEQFAEIIVGQNDSDPNTFDPNEDPEFFLVAFKQACNDAPGGCTPGDLLTPAVESNWTSVTVYEDEDIKNTIVDCKHCHQPEGVNTPKFGRMQELADPWTHFMRDNRSGQEITADYYAAHGTAETYGGIPGQSIEFSDPANLEDLVRTNGFNILQVEPIEFATQDIQDEIEGANNAQPADNTTPGVSNTWEQLFQLSAQGRVDINNDPNNPDFRNIIPIPYHDVKVTEPALLEKFTRQYQDFLAGTITPAQMEDHRYIFRTSQQEQADMGFAIRENTPPETILIQACFQCHNSQLDQSLTRAKFNVDLAAMGANAKAEIDIAIERLKLGYTEARLAQEEIKFFDEKTMEEKKLEKGEHILTMPPRRFKSLTDSQIDSVIEYLKTEQAKLP